MKRSTWLAPYRFSPEEHQRELSAIIREIEALPSLDSLALHRILVKYPKNGNAFFSKSEIIRGYRHFTEQESGVADAFIEKVRMKPVRTLSGVTPVTVLTQPYPCPGRCIFCPNDVRMPKSYLVREPGAQRAGRHGFDPYQQTQVRLRTLDFMGHPVDKVELIILGGTWSFYPEAYQIWFVRRCFEAMNERVDGQLDASQLPPPPVDFTALPERVDGRFETNPYNSIVRGFLRSHGGEELGGGDVDSAWAELMEAQRLNERSFSRCVGLSVETRPDLVSESELERIRRIGATKVQIGYQSLSDEVLQLNKRGHDVAATRKATRLLRQAGFKIQAHWMPNLYGSSPERDVEDFEKMFSDADFRPDELKIYPCSLVESAELMVPFEEGKWRPYAHEELVEVLSQCLKRVPPYCRVSRIIRDIPGEDILVGNKLTNFRVIAETETKQRGWVCRDIRTREIRSEPVRVEDLQLDEVRYRTSAGEDFFLQFVAPEDRIVGFLRLCLPTREPFVDELRASALIREVHVYGAAVGIGKKAEEKSQHSGLGTQLIRRAENLASRAGYRNLAVISSVGTREYYRRLGFRDGDLYQHLPIGTSLKPTTSPPSAT